MRYAALTRVWNGLSTVKLAGVHFEQFVCVHLALRFESGGNAPKFILKEEK